MSAETKSHPGPTIRIETAGFGNLVPPYGASLDELPAAFWATFADALAATANEEALDHEERLLIGAAHDLAYRCGRDVASSWPWAPYVSPPDCEDATPEDVLNAIVATLATLGLDGCRVVELVPFERLVVRVPMNGPGSSLLDSAYRSPWLATDRRASRARELEVRGFCSGIMELAYGPRPDPAPHLEPVFQCRRTGASDLGEGAEFIVSRRER